MDSFKRQSLLALLALPTGCTLQYLPPLTSTRISKEASPVRTVRSPALGQAWTYKKFNFYNSALADTVKEEVTSMDGGISISRHSQLHGSLTQEFQPVWGQVTQDPYWDFPQTYETPIPLWPGNFETGSSQITDTHYRSANSSFRYWISIRTTVIGQEMVKLPCGSFDTVRIEKLIRLEHRDIGRLNTMRTDIIWFAPEIGRWVVKETNGEFRKIGKRGSDDREDHFRWQLENWI